MDTRLFHTQIKIEFDIVGQPQCVVSIDDLVIYQDVVKKSFCLCYDQHLTPGNHKLKIDHKNKSCQDSSTALIIKSLEFNSLGSPKFIWAGKYYPDYPEPWATEQRNAGSILEPELAQISHLGWNGTWILEFSAPIFTWIHHVEDMGWIHSC
jgi:hypothetical protein